MRFPFLLPLAVPFLALSCKRTATPPAPVVSANVAAPVASAANSGGGPQRDPRSDEVERAVQEWQRSQNALDFAAYSALYTGSFVGTKRVGEQSFRFDRKRWLLDRKPMFTKGLDVQVSRLEVASSGAHVVAFFQQDFKTSAFRDTGRKLLAFAKTPEGYRIVREEMLSSRVQGGGGSVRAVPGFFFARPDGVVLRSEIDERWLTPARREIARQFRVARDSPDQTAPWPELEDFVQMNEIRLPPEILAFTGKTLYVTQAPVDGALRVPCEARIKSIRLLNTAAPSFESVRGGMGHDHIFSVVVFGAFEKQCPDALWASESQPGTQYLPHPAGEPLLTAAKAIFASKTPFPALEVTQQAAGPQQHLLFARGWRDGDDNLRQIENMLLAAVGGALPVRLLHPIDPDVVPRLAFDADGDGQFEILTRPGGDWATVSVLQLRGDKLITTPVYSVPDFVCPG